MYSKEALLEQRHQMFCINSETIRFQLTSRLRNGRFQPGITRTIGNALIFKKIFIFFLYYANIKFEIHKKKTYSKKLKWQEKLAMHSFYILQLLNLKFTKKDMDTQKN